MCYRILIRCLNVFMAAVFLTLAAAFAGTGFLLAEQTLLGRLQLGACLIAAAVCISLFGAILRPDGEKGGAE